MDKIFLYDTKTLKSQINTKIFVGDNLITKIKILIPDNIGGYPKRECEFNLRAIIPEGNLSYMINPSQPYFYITNDITEKAQTVKLMMIITHAGNVIGRTNAVDLIVNEPAEAHDPPLTPREEFDEVIAEQRAEIAEQAETISSQASQIEQDSETISGLNSQVSELSTENGTLQTQHTADQSTIQYLINNPPEVRLQSKSVNPTAQMQTVEPDSGYGGLSSVTVGAVTPPRLQGKAVSPTNLMQNVQPDNGYDGLSNVAVAAVTAQELGFDYADLKEGVEFLGGTGTYNPFPYQSKGGVFILEMDEDLELPSKLLIEDYPLYGTNKISYDNISLLKGQITNALTEITFKGSPNINTTGDYWFGHNNCPAVNLKTLNLFDTYITTLGENFCSGISTLQEVRLPKNLEVFGAGSVKSCGNLKTINIPASLITITNKTYCLQQCSSLEYVTIENGFNCDNLVLAASTKYSVETIVSWLNALADRTGETAYTLTIGTTNKNKLTAEQIAIATNKNWNLA